MSREHFEAFRAAVLADEALQDQVRRSSGDKAELTGRIVALSAQRGLDVDTADVAAAIADSRRAWVERWLG